MNNKDNYSYDDNINIHPYVYTLIYNKCNPTFMIHPSKLRTTH